MRFDEDGYKNSKTFDRFYSANIIHVRKGGVHAIFENLSGS